MRISDWSSDVCSSDLGLSGAHLGPSQKAPSTDHQSWNPTIDHLRAARNLLTELEASRAVTAVRRALASAEGAGRHLEHPICKSGAYADTKSPPRSEERRGGKEGAKPCKSWVWRNN